MKLYKVKGGYRLSNPGFTHSYEHSICVANDKTISDAILISKKILDPSDKNLVDVYSAEYMLTTDN